MVKEKFLKYRKVSKYYENDCRLKLEVEQFGRMLRLRWHFRNCKKDIPNDQFKTKSTFNATNKDAAMEIFFRSLERFQKTNLTALLRESGMLIVIAG